MKTGNAPEVGSIQWLFQRHFKQTDRSIEFAIAAAESRQKIDATIVDILSAMRYNI